MKLIHIFIAIVSFRFAMNLEIIAEFTTLCKAINSIVMKGDILTPPINMQLLDMMLGYCIKTSNSTFLTNVSANPEKWRSQSSLLIVEKEDDISNQTHSSMNHNGHHLVVIRKYTKGKLNDLVNYFWGNVLINVSFLVIAKSEILLQTFIPYNDRKCNDTELKTINQFDEVTENWRTNEFFPNKLFNFHRCSLKIATHKNVVPYIVREEFVNGERILKGRVIGMIDALATSLNFTAELEYDDSVAAWEICIRKAANNEVTLIKGFHDFTVPIFFEILKIVVPPGRRYTQIEKFLVLFCWLTFLFQSSTFDQRK